MNKKVIFFSIIIIVIISVICVVKNVNKPKLDYNIEVVDSIDYMIFKENNKFGVINKDGEVVIKALYDEIQIPNPSKPLFVCMYNYNTELNQYNVKVLNEKEEQILYQYVYVEAIRLNTPISNVPYEKSVLKYKDKGKYGLINFEGKIIVKAQYDDIESFNYNEGLLLIKKNNKFGVININGATVVSAKYDEIESDGYYDEQSNYKKSGFIVGNIKDEKMIYGYLNYKAKKVLDIKYEQIDRIENKYKSDDIYIIAVENQKAGVYKNNKNIFKHEYDDISYDFNNNCLIMQKDSKQGVADLDGKIVLEVEYDNIFMTDRYINAVKESNIDIIDISSNNKVNLENIVGLTGTTNNQYSIAITNEEKYQIYDTEKNELKENKYDFLQFIYENYFIAVQKEKYGVVDSNGKIIIDFKYDSIQKLPDSKVLQAYIQNNDTTYMYCNNNLVQNMENCELTINKDYIIMLSNSDIKYIDYEGNIINTNETNLKKDYDVITKFNEYGFAGIKKQGKWGVINENGQVIIEPTYELNTNNPSFVGKYYKCDLGYGDPFYTCDEKI